MSDIQKLTKSILKFRNERNWKQFNNQKDMALSLALEAAEVLEHFQWKNGEELEKYVKAHKREIGEELCDVLYWVLLMSYDLKIDLLSAFNKKMLENAQKYPVEKSKGKHTTYNES